MQSITELQMSSGGKEEIEREWIAEKEKISPFSVFGEGNKIESSRNSAERFCLEYWVFC